MTPRGPGRPAAAGFPMTPVYSEKDPARKQEPAWMKKPRQTLPKQSAGGFPVSAVTLREARKRASLFYPDAPDAPQPLHTGTIQPLVSGTFPHCMPVMVS